MGQGQGKDVPKLPAGACDKGNDFEHYMLMKTPDKNNSNSYLCYERCCLEKVPDDCPQWCLPFYDKYIKETFKNINPHVKNTLRQVDIINESEKTFEETKDYNFEAGKAAEGAVENEEQAEAARVQAEESAEGTEEILGANIETTNKASKQANTLLQGAKINATGVEDIAKKVQDSEDEIKENLNLSEEELKQIEKERAQSEALRLLTEEEQRQAEESALSAEEARIQAELEAAAAQDNYEKTSNVITGSAALGNSASGNIINQKANEEILNLVGELQQDSQDSVSGFTNLKEGFSSDSHDLLATILSKITSFVDRNIQATNQAVDIRTKMTHTELLSQDNNIVNNILMDYLINEEEGTNVEKVYNKLNQDSTKKMRTIQMNEYKTKVYKEYIYLLKIIIFSIILIIPILLVTKLELISKNVSLAIVVALIFVVILYLGYRLYILRMRDNINFDKVRMNFDRENAEMLKAKGTSMYEKKGPLSRLGVTCMGDECCDDNMVYDNLRHKCVLQENFGNFFEKLNDNLAPDINIVKPDSSHENNADYTFVSRLSNMPNNATNNVTESFISRDNIQLAKEGLLISSLNNSSEQQFQKNVVPSLFSN